MSIEQVNQRAGEEESKKFKDEGHSNVGIWDIMNLRKFEKI